MLNVLMVTLEFPPVNSTGCYRYIKLLRHLKKYGINPIVIAPTVESSKRLWENRSIDSNLETLIPKDIEVHRLPISKKAYIVRKKLNFFNKLDFYLKHTDNASSMWRPALIKFLDEYLKNTSIDVLYVSAPPFSLCKLATDLSIKYQLPLLLDLRDDWLFNKGNPFPTRFHFYKAKVEFKAALYQATRVNVVTPQLVSMMAKAVPSIPLTKYCVITNGFDQDEINLLPFKNSILSKERPFKIGYSGEFYFNPETHKNAHSKWWCRKGIRKINYSSHLSQEDWTYRSPFYFLKTLRNLFEIRPDLRSHVFFEHIGSTPKWLFYMVKEMGLEDNFYAHGFVTKKANIEIQKNWDAILVTSEKVSDGEHYCISSKIFDAILIQKPILGFVTNGASKDLLINSGCSLICDPDQYIENVRKIEKLIIDQTTFEPNINYLSGFLPETITASFAREIFKLRN